MLQVSCSKFSQLSNSEKMENLSTIDKVTVCNTMYFFLDHPVCLLLYDVSGVRHRNVTCDICRMSGLRGIRWKCTECDDFDLCHDCYMSNKHDLSHAFIRYDTALSIG